MPLILPICLFDFKAQNPCSLGTTESKTTCMLLKDWVVLDQKQICSEAKLDGYLDGYNEF